MDPFEQFFDFTNSIHNTFLNCLYMSTPLTYLLFQFWHSWKRNWIWQTSFVYYYILRRFNNCKFTYIPHIFHIYGSKFQNRILQFNLPMHYVWFLSWDSTKKGQWVLNVYSIANFVILWLKWLERILNELKWLQLILDI